MYNSELAQDSIRAMTDTEKDMLEFFAFPSPIIGLDRPFLRQPLCGSSR